MIYSIENDYLDVYISTLGGTIVKFIDKKLNVDLILGYDTEKEYLKNSYLYSGAMVGRCANIIRNSRFRLNNQEYIVSSNDNNNCLHGGFKGVSFVNWKLVNREKGCLVLSLESKDNDEGFPGNLKLEVRYSLEKNCLVLEIYGKCDRDSILNITNHMYFNLGSSDVNNLYLKIPSNYYTVIDDEGLPTETVENVFDTYYDFTDYRNLGDVLSKIPKGIDNNYLFENLEYKELCKIKNDKIEVTILSDMPDLQVYTANDINYLKGKNNEIYRKHCAVALEPQYYPNSINLEKFIKPIIKRNDDYKHIIKYCVREKK